MTSGMTPAEWAEVKEIFSRARELPAPERATFLEHACAGSPDRRREVESLLAFSEERWSLLDGEPAFAQELARVGRRIGAYEIVSPIGEGGMGTVYLARRTDGQFEQTVALKVVKRGMDTDAVLARFRQEREILARLHHPNIAQLYDGGATDDGLPYFVMELVEGEPLLEHCRRRNLSVAARLALFRSVCAAVHYAHRSLVVHRDLKPSNILVTFDGVPKLLDFGIAKIQEDSAGDRTATSLRAMTPDYASPEQIRGEPITTATDVYSLGVVLYELLTERKPFRLKDAAPEEVSRVVCHEEPERPGAVVRELRGDVENIVLMAMRKEPERRYGSAERLDDDIRRCQEGLPVLARRDTVGYRAGKFIRRNRLGVAAAALIFVALAGGLAWNLREARRARAAEARAERRFEDVRTLANSFLFEFQDSIQNLAGSTPARQLLVRRGLEYLDRLAVEAGNDPRVLRDLGQGYRKLGALQGDFGSGSTSLGDTDGSIQSYRKAQAILEALFRTKAVTPEDRLALADLYSDMSDPIARRGETDDALALARKSVAIGEAVAGLQGVRRVPRLTVYHQTLGIVLKYAGREKEALAAFQEGARAAERLSRAEPANTGARRSLAIAHLKVGDSYGDLGEPARAVEAYRLGLEIETALAASDPANGQWQRDLSFFHQNLAEVLRKSGDGAGAVEPARKALELRKRLAAADPSNAEPRLWLASAHAELGTNLVRSGDVTSGLSSLKEAIAVFDAVIPAMPDNPVALQELALCQSWLGGAYRKAFSVGGDTARLRDARAWLAKSLKTYSDLQSQGRLPAGYSEDVARVRKDLASCEEELARPEIR